MPSVQYIQNASLVRLLIMHSNANHDIQPQSTTLCLREVERFCLAYQLIITEDIQGRFVMYYLQHFRVAIQHRTMQDSAVAATFVQICLCFVEQFHHLDVTLATRYRQCSRGILGIQFGAKLEQPLSIGISNM